MTFSALLEWLENTNFSVTMRGSTWAEPLAETVHVLTLTAFFGFAVLLDLRLLGVCLRQSRMSEVLKQLNPLIISAFFVMIITGVLLFCGDPVAFYSTVFFRAKMIMLALAIANVLIFNATLRPKIAEWDENPSAPGGVKLVAVVSLVLWAAIIAAGRAIAYAVPPP